MARHSEIKDVEKRGRGRIDEHGIKKNFIGLRVDQDLLDKIDDDMVNHVALKYDTTRSTSAVIRQAIRIGMITLEKQLTK